MHRSRLPILHPCSESWDTMSGAGARRHCAACDRQVLDLSALTEQAATAALQGREGRTCVRYKFDRDGNVRFAPAPPPPRVVAPQDVAPQAITPQVIAPRAIAPRAVAPRAVAAQAVVAAALVLAACAGWEHEPESTPPDELGMCTPEQELAGTCEPGDPPRKPPPVEDPDRDAGCDLPTPPTDRDATTPLDVPEAPATAADPHEQELMGDIAEPSYEGDEDIMGKYAAPSDRAEPDTRKSRRAERRAERREARARRRE